jgi:hypothetical protein
MRSGAPARVYRIATVRISTDREINVNEEPPRLSVAGRDIRRSISGHVIECGTLA